MKKRNIIFAAIILILGIVYLIADSKLYHYGKSKYNIFNYSLPLDMNPDYWGADVCYPIKGLTIEDEFGIVIIGKDEFYLFANDTITINKIIKYGASENKLVALIEDADKHNYFIECKKNTLPHSRMKLELNVLDKDAKLDANYRWINIEDDGSRTAKLVMVRAYSMLIIIITLIILPIVAIVRRKKKK